MQCPTLDELPTPPAGKSGWPWKEESPRLPNAMPDGRAWPRVSIVTPSYNQAEFIEETIRSVLLQGYPSLEYIVIDGGSVDRSINIIRKYERWLAYWVSEPDRGQSHAINKGFRQADGEIMAWLNSDDFYYPRAVASAVSHLSESKSDIIIGSIDKTHVEEGQAVLVRVGSPNGRGRKIHSFPIFANGRVEDFCFVQPAMFWRSLVWQQTGELNEDYDFIMDWDWCLRALAKGASVVARDDVWTRFNLHPGSKSQDQVLSFEEESARMFKTLGQQPGFRCVPCLLESALSSLTYHKYLNYERAESLDLRGETPKASLRLLWARLLRRAHLALYAAARILAAARQPLGS